VASIEVFEGLAPMPGGGGGDSGGITSWTSIGLDGEVCSGAADKAACLALIEAKKKATTASQLSTDHLYWGQSREMVVVTQGDEVKIATSKEALKELLGPIDTLAKVKLWMRYQFNLGASCKFEVRETAEGFEVWAVGTLINDCPFTNEDQLFLVKSDGSLTLLEKKNTVVGGSCAGRRPEGLAPVAFRDEDVLGRFFARMTHLEAASVDAFLRLADELRALGAPADLLDGCRTAAEDEVRHASSMGALATRFGGALQEPCVAPPRPRTAEELAVENMIEGCVRETYGALVAAYQAERSEDAEVRAAMAEIAREEAEHAGLSWRMHGWLAERLPPESQGKLAEARRRAVEGLRRELDGEVEGALRGVAGLPDRSTALAMLGELESRLWS
jgi:rubrerythrin